MKPLSVLALLIFAASVEASDRPDIDVRQSNDMNAQTTGDVGISAEGGSIGLDGAEFGNVSVQDQRAPSVWLNQSGNLVSCTRVFGIGGSTTNGSFVFGIPAGRQKDCDIWLAVNEAQENGHIALSYAFMCEIKHIRNVWGKERCQEATDAATLELADAGIIIDSELYDQAAREVMAQVSEEEFELYQDVVDEQNEELEYRIAQQQNLINSLEQEQASKDAEIERLRREAEELRRQQEAERAEREKRQVDLGDILRRLEAREEETDE